MNICIYGGTFNPIHFGHTGMALWTLTHTRLDELWLMVTPGNPLKDGQTLAQNEQERLAAARQAIERVTSEHSEELNDKRLVVSDFEFALPRPSYTAQTLRALQEAYPQHQWHLLIGEDNLLCFKRWREWEWIARNFPVLVYPRKSAEGAKTDFRPAADGFRELTFLAGAPYFDISSTQLREEKQRKGSFSLA